MIFDALLAALFALMLLGNINELERPASDANGSDANGSDANGSDANGSDANGSDANGNDLLVNFLSTGPTAALTFCPSLPPPTRPHNVVTALNTR